MKIWKCPAARIIRSVLHALRNRLSHQESFQLIAQLPMALKAVYVDGWKIKKEFQRISHLNEFQISKYCFQPQTNNTIHV